MYKNLLILIAGTILALTPAQSLSQARTSSPFSRFGIGELNHGGFGRNLSMGGTGIGIRTHRHLNNLNPASYTAIDSLSFFFEAGVGSNSQTLRDEGMQQNFSDLNFDYFAFGFPLSPRVGFSFGLKPAAAVGYNFQSTQGAGVDAIRLTTTGQGNFSNLYGGVAYQVTPSLSAGIHASFWFGKLQHFAFQEFLTGEQGSGVYNFGTRQQHHVSNLDLEIGAQHVAEFNPGQRLIIGAVFSPRMRFNGESSIIRARSVNFPGSEYMFEFGDTINSEITNWDDIALNMPLAWGVGVSYVHNDQLTLAADYSSRLWGDVTFPDVHTRTANTGLLAVGAEFIPDERTGTRYFQRVRYRAGAYFHNDYRVINNYQLRDFGMSFGLGLPMRQYNTSINLGLQVGRVGTGRSGELSETYTKVTLNFTMHEFWFMQRRFE